MKPENQDNNETTQNIDELIDQAGYPDISKANTKTVVLWSLVVVLIVLFLSVMFPNLTNPENTATKTTQEEATTKVSSTTDANSLYHIYELETSGFAEVFSMPKLQPPTKGFHTINNVTYYLREGSFPYNGWLTTDDACYYIKEDGSVTTGWNEILHKHYYFDEKGIMQKNQWIDQCYLGADGVMYVNTMTPDGIYVGNDGKEDTSLGKHNSIDGLKELRKTLEDKLASYSGKWSIYVKDIDRNEYLSINNQQIFSASLIKLFCAASAYDLIRKGTMEESERIQSLMTQMISISDNDAFNLMVAECSGVNSQIAGRPIIQAFIDQEGFQDTTITSMLLPTKFKSPSSPGRNYTTVDDFGLLLEKIYKGKCVDLESSNKLLNLLLNQSHTNKIPASLPEGIKCANKTGDTDEFQHDGAIVYGPNNVYILVIMSENGGPSINRIQELSKIVYDYFD